MSVSWEEFEKHRRWFVTFRDPKELWKLHRSYLLIETITILCGVLTLKHAFRRGGRFPYLWFTALIHGLVVESLSYIMPDVDNFWHAQSTVMLLGLRLPLHIIFLYPVFIYTAYAAVSQMRLSIWVEPLAVGLATVLIDVPFDILGIKHLWWTWHDTDPNIADRHYWVPWTSYYFHAAFAASLILVFNASRHFLIGNDKHHSTKLTKDGLCTLTSGLLATPLGVFQFIFLFHTLHDLYSIHTEVCVLIFLTIYALLVWTADRNPAVGARSSKSSNWCIDEIFQVILIWYISLSILAVVVKPEDQRSVGLHEPIGPCEETIPVHTPLGTVLHKRKYLCLKDYDEPYYDFNCVPKKRNPLEDNYWYTICGNPYPNVAEYRVVIWSFCLLGLFVYHQLLCKSASDISSKSSYRKLQSKMKPS